MTTRILELWPLFLGLILFLGILPVIFSQFARRGFLILMIWLFIAPLLSNLVNLPGTNPFFGGVKEAHTVKRGRTPYLVDPETVGFKDLLEPTRLILGLFLISIVGRALMRDRRFARLDRVEKWMIVFSVFLLGSVFFKSNRFSFGMHVAMDSFLVSFLAYIVARRVVTDEAKFRRLTQVLASLGIWVIIVSLIDRGMTTDWDYRVHGPFPTRDHLYVVMMVIFVLALLDAVAAPAAGKSRALPFGIRLFVLIGGAVVIFLTLTRGDWLGFAMGVLTFLFLGRKLLEMRRKLMIIISMTGMIPVIFFLLMEFLPSEAIVQRLETKSTYYGRIATYKAALVALSEKPVFGLGFNNLRDVLIDERASVEGYENYTTAHQSFLSIFVELGITGLLAYLAIGTSILMGGVRLIKNARDPLEKWRGIAVVSLMVAYWVPALFSTLIYEYGLLHVYFFTCVGAIMGRHSLDGFLEKESPSAGLEEAGLERGMPQRRAG